MNSNSCHHPFHAFNNNMNRMQRLQEEPQLRPGTLSQPPFQAPPPGAHASSGLVQPLMQYQAAHHADQPGYHLEGERRPALHEAFVGNGLGKISPVLRQAGTAQPLQDSRPRIFDGQSFQSSQAMAGHLHAAHQMEIQRRQVEENIALASFLRNLSSNCAGADPAPRNHAQEVANCGQEQHGNILARGDGVPFVMLPAPSNTSGNSSGSDWQQQPRLVDYMGVQGVRVALGDLKAMVGSLKGALFDVRAKQGEANNATNLDLGLGCSEVMDLTLRL